MCPTSVIVGHKETTGFSRAEPVFSIPSGVRRAFRLACRDHGQQRVIWSSTIARLHLDVTTARRLFEAATVEHFDIAADITNQAGFLHDAGRRGDAAAAHAKHVGEKLVRQLEMVPTRSVMRHQEPARQPVADIMKARASGGLTELQQQQVDMLPQYPVQRRTAGDDLEAWQGSERNYQNYYLNH